MIKFFKEPVRFIKESNTMESAFEKPYYDLQYNKMHLKWNIPDWEWEWGGHPGSNAPSGDCWSVDNPFCQTWCRLLDNTRVICQLVGGYSHGVSTGIKPAINAVSGSCFGKFNRCSTQQEWEVAPRPGFFEVPSIIITHEDRDTCTEDFEVGAIFTWSEPKCSKSIDYTCVGSTRIQCSSSECEDPPAETSWVTKPSSVNRESSDTELEITGGVSPYSWVISIDGGGATLDFASTNGTINYMDVDDSACGTITVTVTDFCDVVLEGRIRVNTHGLWCLINSCGPACPASHANDNPAWNNICSSSSASGRSCRGYAGRSGTEQTWWSCYCYSWNTSCELCHPDCNNQLSDCSWYGSGSSPIAGSNCPSFTRSCLYNWTCSPCS